MLDQHITAWQHQMVAINDLTIFVRVYSFFFLFFLFKVFHPDVNSFGQEMIEGAQTTKSSRNSCYSRRKDFELCNSLIYKVRGGACQTVGRMRKEQRTGWGQRNCQIFCPYCWKLFQLLGARKVTNQLPTLFTSPRTTSEAAICPKEMLAWPLCSLTT